MASVDVICTDPPYGMGADDSGDGAGRLTAIEHKYGDSNEDFKALLTAAAPLFGRVAKPAAALYLCCDIDQFAWLRDLFKAEGWYVFRTPLINVKYGSGRVPLPDHGPRRQYETILFAYRGGKKVNSIQSDVIITRGDEQMGHGAQKPVALFQDLLARSCRPGVEPILATQAEDLETALAKLGGRVAAVWKLDGVRVQDIATGIACASSRANCGT